MKNLYIFFLTIVFTVYSCSDFIHIPDNLNDENFPPSGNTVEERIGFEFSAYPLSEYENVDCLVLENQYLILKKGLFMRGNISHSGNLYSSEGDLKVHSCSLDEAGNNIIEEISGIITVDDVDLIFYSGTITVNYKTSKLYGEFVLANGTGKFISCKGNLLLSGSIDFASGNQYMNGYGTIIFN